MIDRGKDMDEFYTVQGQRRTGICVRNRGVEETRLKLRLRLRLNNTEDRETENRRTQTESEVGRTPILND